MEGTYYLKYFLIEYNTHANSELKLIICTVCKDLRERRNLARLRDTNPSLHIALFLSNINNMGLYECGSLYQSCVYISDVVLLLVLSL